PFDRRDAHLEHGVPMIRTGLGQRLDPRNACAKRLGVEQQLPDLLRLALERVATFDLHVLDATRHTLPTTLDAAHRLHCTPPRAIERPPAAAPSCPPGNAGRDRARPGRPPRL